MSYEQNTAGDLRLCSEKQAIAKELTGVRDFYVFRKRSSLHQFHTSPK
jgi:hypothetical protein